MADDYIRRQAAIDVLDEIRHALWEIDIPSPTVPEYVEHHEQVQSVWKLLDKKQKELYVLPSAQPTQEIIHCKDCRFWKKYKYFNGKPTYAPFCGFNSIFTDDNDFCSRAEKRGEADG